MVVNELDKGSKSIGVGSRIPTIKKLSSAEIQERGQKRLCFNCEEKFEVGHKYKRLFLIDAYTIEELERWQGEIGQEAIGNESQPEISIRALKGCVALDTMRMIGRINKKAVILLLDTCSTHNFLSKDMVNHLNISSVDQKPMKVKVASGEQINSIGWCRQVPMSIQGHEFLIAFFVLDLSVYDVVLGTK